MLIIGTTVIRKLKLITRMGNQITGWYESAKKKVKLSTRMENQKDCLPFGMNLVEREWRGITRMGKKRGFKLVGMSQEKRNKKSIFKKERKQILEVTI